MVVFFETVVVSCNQAFMGVGRGGLAHPLDFEIIGKKRLFFNFEG